MRVSISILSGTVLGVIVWAAAIASPAAAATVEKNCQKIGGEVSALIDTKGTSPNISTARHHIASSSQPLYLSSPGFPRRVNAA
jgi:hypothetical protein